MTWKIIQITIIRFGLSPKWELPKTIIVCVHNFELSHIIFGSIKNFQNFQNFRNPIFVISSKSLSNLIRYFEFIRSIGVKFSKFYQFGGRKCSNSVHIILLTVPYTGTFNPNYNGITKSNSPESLKLYLGMTLSIFPNNGYISKKFVFFFQNSRKSVLKSPHFQKILDYHDTTIKMISRRASEVEIRKF